MSKNSLSGERKRKVPQVTASSGWLTFEAGAQYVGVSVKTLKNWEDAGCFITANVIVPGCTRGRRLIKRESLDAFLDSFIGAPPAEIAMNANKEGVK